MTASPQRPEDRAFADWRRTGDPHHLGEVFDRVAGKLAILAVHLTRMPADAEDLVQATFVAAIESAARWDERQPVLPWLTGILANLVKMRQRRGQRVLTPERVARRTTEEPADAAAWHEIAQEVAQALDGLDETYRTVLMLRVLHGLRPAEIARALGRPQETVRTQLHRGLRLLRERLPRSLGVTALAAILWPARGMAAVRAAVLARAGSAVGAAMPAAAIGLGGLFVMSAKTWSLLAAGALALAGIAGMSAWQAFAAPGSTAIDAAVAADPARDIGSRPIGEPDQAASRRVFASTPATDAAAPSHLAELRGRCIADENGAPLQGIPIEFNGQSNDRDQPSTWTDPQPIATGADGRFVVRFDPPARHSFFVRALPADRVLLSARWSGWARGTALDVGDVRMPAGVPVRACVHEPDGTPRAAVALSAHGAGVAFGSEAEIEVQHSGRTNRDGRIDLGRMPAGVLRLDVREARLLSANEFVVRSTDAALTLDVIVAPVDPEAVLAGVVVDEAGRPLPDMVLRAQETRGPQALGRTTTAADGTFTLRCSAERGAEATLEVDLPATGIGARQIDPPRGTPFRVGARDLRLTVAAPARAGTVTIQVVAAATQRPVEHFRVRCLPDTTRPRNVRSSREQRLRLSGQHPGGVLEIDEVEDCAMLLIVQPDDPALMPSGPIQFSAPHPTPLRVALLPQVARAIEVMRRDGRPVAGTRVELLHTWGEGTPGIDTPAFSFSHANPFTNTGPKLQSLLLATEFTDATGHARVQGPNGQEGLTVRVMGPGCVPTVVHPVTWTSDEPLRCVVDTGATIEGRVVPADFFARMRQGVERRRTAAPGVNANDDDGVGVQLVDPADQRRVFPLLRRACPVAADGSFHIDGIPPGTWSLAALWWCEMGSGSRVGTSTGPWLTLPLVEGQIARVDLDLAVIVPARVRGQIVLDGARLAGANWEMHPARSPLPPFKLQWLGGKATDADGRFVAPAVVPGTYRLRVYRGQQSWFDDGEIAVAPGAEVEHEVHLVSHRLRIRLQTQDGKAAGAGRLMRYTFPFGRLDPMFRVAESDAEGVVTFDPAPPFAIDVSVLDHGGEAEFWLLRDREQHMLELGTVPAPRADQREIEVTFRLPPPR